MNDHEIEQFILTYGCDILRFCRMTAGGSEAGDDLYQDTMLKLTEKKEQAENNTDAKMSGEDGQAEQKGSAESESNEAKAVSETAATVDTAEATASSENPADSADTQNL